MLATGVVDAFPNSGPAERGARADSMPLLHGYELEKGRIGVLQFGAVVLTQ